MKKKKIAIIIVAIVILILLIYVFITKRSSLMKKGITALKDVEGITIVPTMNDELTKDSAWCGTFQLIWNDMKNEVVKKDIIFNPQLEMVKNLNKEDFNVEMISEDYYYKIYGLKNQELKKEIENGIKDKFNQTSDILGHINWGDGDGLDNPNNYSTNNYFFYCMLYRKFEFIEAFNKLDKGKFGEKYNNINYFGIDSTTKKSVRNQIRVLYYNSKDDFAIIIYTKTDDEVIFCKSPEGENFNQIYENMIKNSNTYLGNTKFTKVDEFKAPYIEFDELKEFYELENNHFLLADGNDGVINQAIQSIKFTIDEKGGEIKSEAGIGASFTSIDKPEYNEPRYFYVDDTFTIFLREQGKEKPYFAGRIENITKFQNQEK